jgi:excisionase family DNA binding protein
MAAKDSVANIESAYCTTREAAEMLGVSLRTAQLWVDSGILEAWKTDGGHRRIKVDSVQRLLREQKPMVQAAEMSGDSAALTRLKVLVVEDDNVLLKLYRLRIAAWQLPVDVTTASNGYEALVLIGREQPDLMIADLNMPGLDGFQMVRTLVTSSFREGMQIVVVTGLDADDVASRGGLPEGVRLFSKPVPFAELREIASDILRHRSSLSV